MLPVDSKRNLEPGHCYIASLESHIIFKKGETDYCVYSDATSCSRSGKGKNMDDFIRAAVENFTGDVHAVFLSGTMGIEKSSIEAIRDNKGKIIVQQPSSCMMPTFLDDLAKKKMADIIASPDSIVGEVMKLT
jgi:chemotaxis response regulator CheB